VDRPDKEKARRVVRETMRLWKELVETLEPEEGADPITASGVERLASAWLLGTALDWSLELGLETKEVTDVLFTRVSAYLKTHHRNGERR
jgi:hypothetical protein